MPNPLFSALNGDQQPNMIQQFTQFMNTMKGRDPNKIIDEMVSSGKISQAQLNEVQQKAQQIQGAFDSVRSMFGM